MTRSASLSLALCALSLLAGLACTGQKSNGADAGGVNLAVTVTPAAAQVTVGATLAFQARLALGDGWSWQVVPASLGTFTPDGVFRARAAGSGVVVATWTRDVRYVGTTPVQVLPAPVATISAAPTVSAGSAAQVASVPVQPGCSYAWTITGGTLVGGADTDTVSYVADGPGQVRLDCVVTNPAGVQAETTYLVTVVERPEITLFQGLPALVRPGSGTWLYARFRGAGLAVVSPGGATVASGGSVAVALGQSTEFTLTVTNSAGEQAQARTTVLVGDPCPPGDPAPGQVWTDPATGLDLVWCPPGTATLGAGAGDPDALPVELPAYPATLAQGFWMTRTKVTQDQWRTLMGANPAFFSDLTACSGFGAYPARPVEQVSWEDVQDFLARLNDRLGWDAYRLPSETEWEYACRAGSSSRFPWGDAADPAQAADWAWSGTGAGQVVWPVGLLRPNAWNLHDLAGDAQEWVADRYLPDHQGVPAGGRAALDLTTPWRAVRGSSWADPIASLRVSARTARPQGHRAWTLGFRLVRPPCAAPVVGSFSAVPAAVLPAGGGQAALAWQVDGATRVWIDQGVGEVTGQTGRTVNVTRTTLFTLAAENADGWSMATVKVEVAQ